MNLSLEEYFAGQALSGLIGSGRTLQLDELVRESFKIAEAMKARAIENRSQTRDVARYGTGAFPAPSRNA